MRLGDTIADLTSTHVAADPAIIRRIERPSSASIDVVERMDLPNGFANERIAASIKHKSVVGARDGPGGAMLRETGPSSPLGHSAVQPVPGSRYGGHVEVWYFLVTIRHYSAVHYRAHAAVVAVSANDEHSLLSVVPCAALHRQRLVLGTPIPVDIARHLRGAEPLRDSPHWAIRLHAPVLADHLLRFDPVARVLEHRIGDAHAVHRHCGGRLWHLVDALEQLGLVAPVCAYADEGRARSPRDHRLPADVLLQNLVFTVMGGVVDSASSTVTAVDPCDPPPVYDSAVLRAFLKKTPELASALQIVARQKDTHRDIREAFRNLRTAVSTAEWWTAAQTVELTLEEFCAALVMTGYYVYAGQRWPPEAASAEEDDGHEVDEALNALETGSSISGTATTITRKGAVAPAIVHVATAGVARAVDQFAQSWPELTKCTRRSDFILPAACFQAGDDELVLNPPAKSRQPSASASLAQTPRGVSPKHVEEPKEPPKDAGKGDGKEGGKGKKGVPPPPPVPASVACLHPKAKLAPRIVPVGGLGDIPPLATPAKLPVRPRSTPIEEPKKKRGAKK
uniref:Uncharacterized protein n=1 Tax=Neobodo designis TaxID=312471 RepID=A0A7S1LNP2_NEODS|mmetsp:Transcript_25563/g.78878  ORF Transcript_25563/g.78878 Transcript_25563/m.78878 type:complete len:567 (+) Transcript_25563:2-1702(+)